ncbi:hypothetical protein P4C99_04855 [Pontiellaceae bacterium B1224]|nr:hypothetical protein [Pontiellaceae bacterium B1224]
MKIWILSLIAATLISGCTTLPTEPTPHLRAYSFQVLEIDVPLSGLQSGWKGYPSNSSLADPTIENLLSAPKVRLYEYPIICANLGDTVSLEEIEKVSLVADFIVVDGQAVTQEAIFKLGTSIKITLEDVVDGVASFSIDLGTRDLKGFDTIHMAGAEIDMPVFFDKQLVTSMRHELNSWMSLGAIEDITHKKSGTFRKYFAIRITPPYFEIKSSIPNRSTL